MKTNLLKSVFVIAIAMIAGINVYNAQKAVVLSDVAMANVEALANNEDSIEDCKGSAEYSFVGLATGVLQEYCHKANGKDQLNIYDVERCVADGSGTLHGVTGILSKFLKSSEEVDCTGKCQNDIIW